MGFQLEVGHATDVGRQRQRNEDSLAVFVPSTDADPSQLAGLLLVADGMGGERAGDRASRMAAEQLRFWFSSGAYRSWSQFSGDRPLESALIHALREISASIFKVGDADPTIRGMGSTVVIGVMTDHQMALAHVGDSRCYLIRRGAISQLTSDHSWVQRQVDAGYLTQEDARRHPQRNILIRSLGDALPPEVDVRTIGVQDNDLFVLCSDGLTGSVTEDEILQFTNYFRQPQQLADALLRLANDKDGSDNITVVVGRCKGEDDGSRRSFENEKTHRIDMTEFKDEDTRPDFDPEQTRPDLSSQLFQDQIETAELPLKPLSDEIETKELPRLAPEAPEVIQVAPVKSAEVRSFGFGTWLKAALIALMIGVLTGIVIEKSFAPTAAASGAAPTATAAD
jgi:PPM family protein phosphatase